MYFYLETKNWPYRAYVGHSSLSPTPHLHSHLELVLCDSGVSVATADSVDAKLGSVMVCAACNG